MGSAGSVQMPRVDKKRGSRCNKAWLEHPKRENKIINKERKKENPQCRPNHQGFNSAKQAFNALGLRRSNDERNTHEGGRINVLSNRRGSPPEKMKERKEVGRNKEESERRRRNAEEEKETVTHRIIQRTHSPRQQPLGHRDGRKKTWTERIDRGGVDMRWDGNNQTRMGTGIGGKKRKGQGCIRRRKVGGDKVSQAKEGIGIYTARECSAERRRQLQRRRAVREPPPRRLLAHRFPVTGPSHSEDETVRLMPGRKAWIDDMATTLQREYFLGEYIHVCVIADAGCVAPRGSVPNTSAGAAHLSSTVSNANDAMSSVLSTHRCIRSAEWFAPSVLCLRAQGAWCRITSHRIRRRFGRDPRWRGEEERARKVEHGCNTK
ncbi:hypothetical protein C8J57DRAFT_1265598 [Mycena rebaudengoi]|nr:hypothetical protein C8J57DRAFT_1265598 [Mycena rebaudengoi]